jgi:hypothetical protein
MKYSESTKQRLAHEYSRAADKDDWAKRHYLTRATLDTWVGKLAAEAPPPKPAAEQPARWRAEALERLRGKRDAQTKTDDLHDSFLVLSILKEMTPAGRRHLIEAIRLLLADDVVVAKMGANPNGTTDEPHAGGVR